MVKNTNKRITITITKGQFKWLSQQAKIKDITLSKFISWLLVAKASEIRDYLDLNVNSFDELREIAIAKWLDD